MIPLGRVQSRSRRPLRLRSRRSCRPVRRGGAGLWCLSKWRSEDTASLSPHLGNRRFSLREDEPTRRAWRWTVPGVLGKQSCGGTSGLAGLARSVRQGRWRFCGVTAAVACPAQTRIRWPGWGARGKAGVLGYLNQRWSSRHGAGVVFALSHGLLAWPWSSHSPKTGLLFPPLQNRVAACTSPWSVQNNKQKNSNKCVSDYLFV